MEERKGVERDVMNGRERVERKGKNEDMKEKETNEETGYDV